MTLKEFWADARRWLRAHKLLISPLKSCADTYTKMPTTWRASGFEIVAILCVLAVSRQ